MATITSPRSPRALVLSTLLHALVVVLVLLIGWWSKRKVEETPQIFELVAGDGQNYAATEAPTTAVKMPELKLEPLEPEPVVTPAPQPEPKQVVEPPPTPKVTPKQEKAPTPKQETPPVKKTEKAPPTPKQEPAPKKIRFEDFNKKNPVKTPTPKTAPKITPKKIDAEKATGRLAGATTNSVSEGAGGKALTRAEMDLWDAYQAMLIQRIRRALEAAGMTDNRAARVQFRLSAQGAISNARITNSSGSSEFDAAVLQAFRSIGALGPPPTGGAQELSVLIELRERS